MDNLMYNVLIAVITALIGIVVRELIPYIREQKENALAELRQTKWSWAADIVDTVVRAVEQTLSDQLHGEDKKDEAVRLIRKLTYSAGIQLTDDQISTLIEASVHALNEGKAMDLPAPVIGFDTDQEGGVDG